MKYVTLIISFTIFISCASKQVVNENEIVITQETSKKALNYLVLKNVSNDSRCPQGVECIWAGEVTAEIEVYENNILKQEKTVIFNSKNREENNKWFENYYSKKINTIQVLPYPKDGKSIKNKEYFIKITFLKN